MSIAERPPLPAQRVTLSTVLKRLKMCAWYWGELSSQKAEEVLTVARDGSFLVRDSNDACHLFTLSLKRKKMVISVRVAFSRGLFKLDSSAQGDCPSFTCVVELVNYYLIDNKRSFYVDVPAVGEIHVHLRHPMLKCVSSLQHLCRAVITTTCNDVQAVDQLPLPNHLKRYVSDFCPGALSS